MSATAPPPWLKPPARDLTPAAHRAAAPTTPPALAVVAVLQAVLFAGSPLLAGLYGFAAWGALSLVLLLVLVAVLLSAPIGLPREAGVALGGLVGLVAWSALSMTWAESADRAWTEVNRFALYATVLATVVLTVRTVRSARLVAAALAATVGLLVAGLSAHLALTGGTAFFVDHRLSEPLGYANGLAGFLVIGLWALLAGVEPRGHLAARGGPLTLVVRAGALALAVLAIDLLVLTQSRAIVPALVASAVVVFAVVPGRCGRGWALVAVAGGVAPALPGLLEVYATRLSGQGALPAPEMVQGAMTTAWLAALAVGVLWAVACAAAPRLPQRLAGLSARGLVAVALLLAIAALGAVDRPLERAHSEVQDFTTLRFDDKRDSRFASAGGNRYDLWRIALGQAADHPVRGVGAGGYASTYYLERRSPDDDVRQPHSLGLQVLAELGVIGALALLAFLGAVLWAGTRARPGAIATHDRFVRVAALGGFTAWLAHTSVDWLHNLPGVTGMALIGAGLLLARTPPAQAAPGSGATRRRRSAAGLAIIVVVIAAASTGRQLGALHEREAAAGLLARDPAAALARADSAVALSPGALENHYVRAAAQARLGQYTATRTTLLHAARLEPHNHVPWALLGDLATRRGDRRLALSSYRHAHALNPRDPALAALTAGPRSHATR